MRCVGWIITTIAVTALVASGRDLHRDSKSELTTYQLSSEAGSGGSDVATAQGGAVIRGRESEEGVWYEEETREIILTQKAPLPPSLDCSLNRPTNSKMAAIPTPIQRLHGPHNTTVFLTPEALNLTLPVARLRPVCPQIGPHFHPACFHLTRIITALGRFRHVPCWAKIN